MELSTPFFLMRGFPQDSVMGFFDRYYYYFYRYFPSFQVLGFQYSSRHLRRVVTIFVIFFILIVSAANAVILELLFLDDHIIPKKIAAHSLLMKIQHRHPPLLRNAE